MILELLADSNEKMKECISTTERLKADHEENKKKHETSREIINQVRKLISKFLPYWVL